MIRDVELRKARKYHAHVHRTHTRNQSERVTEHAPGAAVHVRDRRTCAHVAKRHFEGVINYRLPCITSLLPSDALAEPASLVTGEGVAVGLVVKLLRNVSFLFLDALLGIGHQRVGSVPTRVRLCLMGGGYLRPRL